MSGGSIANGVAAATCPDLGGIDHEVALARFRPTLRNLAGDGLFFFSPRTNWYVYAFFALAGVSVLAALVALGGLIGAAESWSARSVMTVAIAAMGGVAMLTALKALRRGGFSPAAAVRIAKRAGVGIFVGAVVGAGALLTGVGGPFAGHRNALILCAAAVLLLAVCAATLSARGRVLRSALTRVHFTNDEGRPILLRDLAPPQAPAATSGASAPLGVQHVFCATELQSGDQFYLSPTFLYSHMFGFTEDPGAISVAAAVQASAALPGGFPPQITMLADAQLRFERPWASDGPPVNEMTRMALVDGGVYDNLGEQWHVGYPARVKKWPGLEKLVPPVDILVAANAGKALGWKEFVASGWLGIEVAGLARDQAIQYDQSTAPRRSALVQRFRAASAGVGEPRGVIVHIATSPRKLCEDIIEGDDMAKAARADAWLSVLDAERSGQEWSKTATANASVPTGLSGLGSNAVTELVFHAAVLTRVALHVHLDLGSPGLPDRTAIVRAIESEPCPRGE